MTTYGPPPPLTEPTARRIRVRLGYSLVAVSDRAQLYSAFGPGQWPTYYLPDDDVVPGVLTDETEQDGRRTFTVRAGGLQAVGGAWADPAFPGHVTFSWQQLDWYEEDERVYVHARSPYHRVDTLRSSRRVQVHVDGRLVADSTRPVLLFETGLPVRYYLPYDDVRTDLLAAGDTVTACPFKGTARYWSIVGGPADIAWSYPDPVDECRKIRDLVCFYNEKVDLTLDGEPVPRPLTPWS